MAGPDLVQYIHLCLHKWGKYPSAPGRGAMVVWHAVTHAPEFQTTIVTVPEHCQRLLQATFELFHETSGKK